MRLIDDRGRLFGRLNPVDAAAAAFVLLLVPLAYGTYLLFRPASPRIESVARVAISREELRIAGGTLLSAKLKVRGSGFNPMLRATIGQTPALGFVFENPNSVDVLVGLVPPGAHDLVLFDGVQEVARAKGVVTIGVPSRVAVRLAGRLLELDPSVAKSLQTSPANPSPKVDVTFVALGPVEPARVRVQVGNRAADMPFEGRVERDAVVDVRCDPQVGSEPCTIGGQSLGGNPPVMVMVPAVQGHLRMAVEDVLPTAQPQIAHVRVRLIGGSELSGLRPGDRDAFLDERAAVVTQVGPRGSTDLTVTVRLGVDASREGWRYRGQLVTPGAPFTFATRRYIASGPVVELTLQDATPTTQ